ncbi:MAG: hypothetical protein JRJ29_21005 [Deltaproteobacteria bacterium]|nr:hypothetical protein [Deltaproteobacteria bacterium]
MRIVKDWDWPDLMRQTPGQCGQWHGIRFTLNEVKECDFLVVLNNRMPQPVTVRCPREHVWMVVQEPYYPGLTDWVVEGHEPFAKVFTHRPVPDGSGRYVTAPPAIPWHVGRTYDELIRGEIPQKRELLSWVVGRGNDLPGHVRRARFLRFLQETDLDIDLWGRAARPIEDKWEGLAPYFFSLAVENNSGPDMWTEKLADCFLSWTIPFYSGCTNVEEYFPRQALIRIDLGKPEQVLDAIKREATEENWHRRLPALKEARELVLNRYQLFPFLTTHIKRTARFPMPPRETVTIPAYRRSFRARLLRLVYKGKRRFQFFERG